MLKVAEIIMNDDRMPYYYCHQVQSESFRMYVVEVGLSQPSRLYAGPAPQTRNIFNFSALDHCNSRLCEAYLSCSYRHQTFYQLNINQYLFTIFSSYLHIYKFFRRRDTQLSPAICSSPHPGRHFPGK